MNDDRDPTQPATPRPNFCGGYRCYGVAPAGQTRCATCFARERELREARRLEAEKAAQKGKGR